MTVIADKTRVDEVLLWEMGAEQRFTRESASVQNTDVAAAAVAATGTITFASPTATAAITMAGDLLGVAGNLGAITVEVVQSASESIEFDADTSVLTINANVSGGTNSITELVALIHAHADWVVGSVTNGAGVVTTSTTGTATIAGGYDAIVTPTELQIGQTLVYDTDHYEPAVGNDADAILLDYLKDLTADETVTGVSVLVRGPALIDQDALHWAADNASLDTAAQLTALAALGIKVVREPTKQSEAV